MVREMIKTNAFTLIEVIVTVTLLAVALAIAIPMFGKYNKSFQITSQFNQIEADLNWAKAYAFTKKVSVGVTFSQNSYTITDITNNKTIRGPVQLKYPINTNPQNLTITFAPLGYSRPAGMVFLTQANSLNCTNVSFTRIISGVYDGTKCNP